ncbi:MAG: hydantoinase/oxoprolinase family protein, partial [Myxococcota bacterium]
ARDLGFADVVSSHEIARELGLLARGETASVDAYLTPLLSAHVTDLEAALPGSRLRFMQSSGGLTDGARFRGPTALLSGPAGGVVAASQVAKAGGHAGAIGFDMGGTSTDVSLIPVGELERSFETVIGGVRVKAPMLRIHTVAAGGGSLCGFDGSRLTVGPESAGAEPGPLCYAGATVPGPGGTGGARSESGTGTHSGLTLTDVNYFLGRVQPDRFPFPLLGERVIPALERVQADLQQAGFERSLDAVAAGFVEVANASMAQAIQQVSVSRGVDPRDHALVGFGGAGGQHVCAVARELGIRTVLLHPLAGLLSAYGIGVAEVTWDRARDAGRVALAPGDAGLPLALREALAELRQAGRDALANEGVERERVHCTAVLDLRYAGADTAIPVVEPGDGASMRAWFEAFEASHQARFGYTRPGHAVEIVTLRVQARGHQPGSESEVQADSAVAAVRSRAGRRMASIWFPEVGRVDAPVIGRETLAPGQEVAGPALILEDTGTIGIDPGFRARVDSQGVLVLRDEAETTGSQRHDLSHADPVRLEVFGNRFMSIAEQMGAVLRNTAVSTNIKDRLDYSCAVFDREAGLVANAPHIPV